VGMIVTVYHFKSFKVSVINMNNWKYEELEAFREIDMHEPPPMRRAKPETELDACGQDDIAYY